MKNIGWEDLQVFFHVAQTGGLSGAARELGLSAATIGRRMLALEQKTGMTLFARSQSGYALTPEGTALLHRVRAMQAAARPVEQLLSPEANRPVVRLSAGTATAHFLAGEFRELTRPGDPFVLNFVTTEAVLDIAHREVDLGIRNRPAEAGNLASLKLGTLRFAPYRSRSVPRPDLLEWVSMDEAHARHPAARWLLDEDVPVSVWANTVATVQELVRAGAGIGVMPCMIGDRDPSLARAGDLIEALTETQYLVMHDDDRHQPHLRSVISRLSAVYAAHAGLLAGDRPLRN
ncbi:DNA-binding transcriptional regulator, LysR family [Paracoccus isoporae]|uniref:DNA-binding transcriptional regulator, LysR family n=1 Tax=Paracoccus isoporae TaxID=591205 RepID=A0A1G6WW83_9RHOB|nr:LysR family transcriptional regulator [Paracoccus isoporae]SDD70101.1 DNA-binding transcriptional regulator, LysR family [Paracoccus isoporae]